MIQLKNAMEIFKILPGTNCRDCRVPSCLAFAAAVFNGDKRLDGCPHLDRAALNLFEIQISKSRTLAREEQHLLADLRRKVALTDLAVAAEKDGRLIQR